MRDVKIALVLALALVAIALAIVLSGSPPAVTRAKAPIADAQRLGALASGGEVCQGGEVVPRGTTAMRVWLEAVIGPPLTLTARSGSRVLTSGRRGAGWSTASVTIPVRPVSRTSSDVTVCVRVGQTREPVHLAGVETPARSASYNASHEPRAGRVMVEYLRPGRSSWWSLARSVSRRMGLGHALSGIWVALLALSMVVAMATAMGRLMLREMR
ncbi:MAG TPA: hypothetical protein VK778_11000 [Solirubrobacteraceae bacterium]|jgi:hypothetical protein|nr:hypothetical protein [Solirubrobacteraceae bacterium]